MGQEPDDDGALCGAQAAVSTGYRTALGRADNDFPARRGSDSVGGIGWEHDDDGTAIHVGEFVRLAQCVSG